MNEKPTFEEYVKLMAKKMDIPINIGILQAFSVGIRKRKPVINITRHMQGCCSNHHEFNCADRVIFDDVIEDYRHE